MPFTRLRYQKHWTSSIDFPTYEGSEVQVREDMQYHPNAVRDFINGTLLAELEESGGAALIGDEHSGTVAATLQDVYDTLTRHAEDIKNVAGGEAPEAVRAAYVAFTAEEWQLSQEDATYSLHIPQEKHRRIDQTFGYQLTWLSEDGAQTNTWTTLGTNVHYEAETGEVVLHSALAYNGAIVFFGV